MRYVATPVDGRLFALAGLFFDPVQISAPTFSAHSRPWARSPLALK